MLGANSENTQAENCLSQIADVIRSIAFCDFLEFDFWNLFGIWNLYFGILNISFWK